MNVKYGTSSSQYRHNSNFAVNFGRNINRCCCRRTNKQVILTLLMIADRWMKENNGCPDDDLKETTCKIYKKSCQGS